MIAAAEPAIKQEEIRKRGWALSTATTSGYEPIHRQKYAITDPFVGTVEPVYRLPRTRSSLAREWGATLDALQLNFAELVTQYAVTRNLAVHSPIDEIDVNAHWAALWHRPLQVLRSPAEDILDWDADAEPITGTFALSFEREVLFSFDVKLSKSELRRWNPEVSLHPSDLDPEDE